MTKLKVTPLTGSIGASVEGIDLNSPIDDETFADAARGLPRRTACWSIAASS